MGLDYTVPGSSGGQLVDISTTDHTFSKITKALIVGSAGNLKVQLADGTTLGPFPAGGDQEWFIALKKVFKVGTTATQMTGLF